MTKLTTLVAALLLLAAPAGAGHGHDRRPDVARLERVAYELADSTRDLRRHLERRAHRGSTGRRATLDAVRGLEHRVQRFLAKAAYYQDRPHRLRRKFDRLERAFRHVEHCFAEVRVGRRARREFARVARLVYRLESRVERTIRVASRHRHRDHRHAYRGDRRRDGWVAAWQWPWWTR